MTPRRPGFFSLVLNIMQCHLFCICDTLFSVYDPPIETDLITLMLYLRRWALIFQNVLSQCKWL
jgi:hypothetical protein